jgi:hypothetical protein
LIRLTEARARLELREVATKEDAGDVIEIMKYRYCHYNTVVLELDKNCERGAIVVLILWELGFQLPVTTKVVSSNPVL